jgi:hypothetical protein
MINDHLQITIAHDRAHLQKQLNMFFIQPNGAKKCENIHSKMVRYFVSKKKNPSIGKARSIPRNCVYPKESHFHFITNGM